MKETRDDLTTKELTSLVDALGSIVRAQQSVNQEVYDRITNIEKRISDLEYPKVTLIDEVK